MHAASESAHLESFRHCLRIPRCGRLSSGGITPFHNFVAQSWGATVPTELFNLNNIKPSNFVEKFVGVKNWWWVAGIEGQAMFRIWMQTTYSLKIHAFPWGGYGSIPINTIFRGMNIHKSQLFWCELQGYYWFWHTARYLFLSVECVPCCFRSATRFSLRSATLRVRLSFAPASIISDNLTGKPPSSFSGCARILKHYQTNQIKIFQGKYG